MYQLAANKSILCAKIELCNDLVHSAFPSCDRSCYHGAYKYSSHSPHPSGHQNLRSELASPNIPPMFFYLLILIITVMRLDRASLCLFTQQLRFMDFAQPNGRRLAIHATSSTAWLTGVSQPNWFSSKDDVPKQIFIDSDFSDFSEGLRNHLPQSTSEMLSSIFCCLPACLKSPIPYLRVDDAISSYPFNKGPSK